MRRPRILIMIDQVSRDGLSQLLTARYLARRGVRVLLCNQHTLVGMCERYRPDVVYASWLVGEGPMEYLIRFHRKTRLVLIDQEGGRVGEGPFKRSFQLQGGVKQRVATAAAKVVMWGSAQAAWMRELNLLPADRIVVTGSPRFDPYLVPRASAKGSKHLGVTLRGDTMTSMPTQFMQTVFYHAATDAPDGIGIAYPKGSQYEDRVWHITASAREQFRTAQAFAKRSRAPIVFRPGPWEQPQHYDFLPQRIPTSTVEPSQLQHHYVERAFALLDESSSLGLEGLASGVPVISVQGLIPRMAEHFIGEGGGLFSAPYMACYWKPKTVDEAVELLLKAHAGTLAASPVPEAARAYLQTYHGWPGSRPSSFQIGDALLDTLDAPRGIDSGDAPASHGHSAPTMPTMKEWCYRHLPGSVHALKMKVLCQQVMSADRQLWFRYHYSGWLYPHHREVEAIFEALWQREHMTQTREVRP